MCSAIVEIADSLECSYNSLDMVLLETCGMTITQARETLKIHSTLNQTALPKYNWSLVSTACKVLLNSFQAQDLCVEMADTLFKAQKVIQDTLTNSISSKIAWLSERTIFRF